MGQAVPQWLWFPEPKIQPNSTRYFRFTFTLPAAARKANLLIAADDGYEAFVNGRSVGGGGWEWAKQVEISRLLNPGRNVIAVRVSNAIQPAGLIMRLEVTTADGKRLRFLSDTSKAWRSYDKEEAGWQEPDFSDSHWPGCVATGDALSDPWFPHGDVRRFAGDVFQPEKILAPLRREPPARAEVKVLAGAPRLVINGKPVPPFLFASNGLGDFAADFAAIGCHLFQTRYNLSDVWLGPDRYDFSGWDLHLSRILFADPRAMFLVLIYLAPPRWWMDAHQEELVRYADGVGFVGDVWGGTMAASYASRKWRDEATAALRAALAHFESSPLRSRIIGYHVANGIYGEWHYFGSCHMPDVSKPFTDAFREWARRQYPQLDALTRAWGQPLSSYADIRCPNLDERVNLECDLFRDPARGRFVSDYYRFFHELSADTVLHFARVVKEATGGRVLCGALYCYLLENLWIQEGGHLCGPRVLDSPDLDYVSCPYSYQGRAYDGVGNYLGSARGVGGDAAYRVPIGSVRLHNKLYLNETDTATCLEYDPELTGYGGEGTEDMQGSLNALRRDLGQVLGEGVGTWLLELAPGWYADKKIMAELSRLRGYLARGLERDLSPVAQVAAVCQPQSFFYTSHWKDAEGGEYDLFNYYFYDTQNRALHRLSAPVEFLYVDDIDRARDYPLYVFLNAFYLTDEQIAAIKRKCCRNRATVVWLYAPGFVAPDRLSVERMSDLIGMSVERLDTPGPLVIEVTNRAHPLARGSEERFGIATTHAPRFAVTDPGATRLGAWQGTDLCAFAVKRLADWTSVYIGVAPVPVKLLRNIAAAAGVHLYSSQPDIVYANASYLVLVANGAGRRTCYLRYPMTRLDNGKNYSGEFPLDLAHGEVVFFERSKSQR